MFQIFVFQKERKSMKKQTAVLWVLLGLACVVRIDAQNASQRTLTCEVLEMSNEYRGDHKDLAAVGYIIIRHKSAADRSRFSEWLRNESGVGVTFVTADGSRHRGVLRRLRMCFGRGLLIFVEPVKLQERNSVVLELQPPH
jgi:hypothetical protein